MMQTSTIIHGSTWATSHFLYKTAKHTALMGNRVHFITPKNEEDETMEVLNYPSDCQEEVLSGFEILINYFMIKNERDLRQYFSDMADGKFDKPRLLILENFTNYYESDENKKNDLYNLLMNVAMNAAAHHNLPVNLIISVNKEDLDYAVMVYKPICVFEYDWKDPFLFINQIRIYATKSTDNGGNTVITYKMQESEVICSQERVSQRMLVPPGRKYWLFHSKEKIR